MTHTSEEINTALQKVGASLLGKMGLASVDDIGKDPNEGHGDGFSATPLEGQGVEYFAAVTKGNGKPKMGSCNAQRFPTIEVARKGMAPFAMGGWFVHIYEVPKGAAWCYGKHVECKRSKR